MAKNTPDIEAKKCARKDCRLEGRPQLLKEFGIDNNRPDGLTAYCYDCRSRLARSEYRKQVNRNYYLKRKLGEETFKQQQMAAKLGVNNHPANLWNSAMVAYGKITGQSSRQLAQTIGISTSTLHRWTVSGLPHPDSGGWKGHLYFNNNLDQVLTNLKTRGDMYSLVRFVALCVRDGVPVSDHALSICGIRIRPSGEVETADGQVKADTKNFIKPKENLQGRKRTDPLGELAQ